MPEQIEKSIIIKARPAVVFSALTDLGNFPKFIRGVQMVQPSGGNMTRWKVDGPMGKDLEFTVEATRLDPNVRIGWNTKDLPGDLTTSGQVVLAELPQSETQVNVTLQYEASKLTRLFSGNVEDEVEKALRNLKAYIEGMPERVDL